MKRFKMFMHRLRKTHFKTWLAIVVMYCIVTAPLLIAGLILIVVARTCQKLGDFGDWLSWRVL